MTSPECVSNAILKVDEVVIIDAQQVTGVEVHVSLLENVVELLPLGLLQVSQVTRERTPH